MSSEADQQELREYERALEADDEWLGLTDWELLKLWTVCSASQIKFNGWPRYLVSKLDEVCSSARLYLYDGLYFRIRKSRIEPFNGLIGSSLCALTDAVSNLTAQICYVAVDDSEGLVHRKMRLTSLGRLLTIRMSVACTKILFRYERLHSKSNNLIETREED